MKSLVEMEDRWTVYELLEANQALDVWDEIERKAVKKADAARKAAAPSG